MTSVKLVPQPGASSGAEDHDLIDTTEASQLIGRSVDAVRSAIRRGYLNSVARTEYGRPLMRRCDVIAWAERTKRSPYRHRYRPWEHTYDVLTGFGAAFSTELAVVLDLHPGNVRKHLLVLEHQGRVRRLGDGQWAAVAAEKSDHSGVA